MRIVLVGVVLIAAVGCSRKYEAIARDTFREQMRCAADVEVLERLEYKDVSYWRTEGCGAVMDCRFIDEYETKMLCGWPSDADLAKQRLVIETGCPEGEMRPTKRQAFSQNFPDVHAGEVLVATAIAYRIEACGRTYTCSIPYKYDVETQVTAAEQVECKLALDAQPVAAPPPATATPVPSAAVACGPMSCAGCCSSDLRCVTGTRDDECGTGGQRCVNCSRDEDERPRCSARYTCTK